MYSPIQCLHNSSVLNQNHCFLITYF
uniref:Uncharacterized protein n=1 Tax=Rhizophora mucronata TaxID=61149 RepID=A0A2P2PXY0_RHIMU